MDFKDKWKKEEIENYIFKENLSYKEIGRIYGVSDTYIKKVAKKLGISLLKRKNFPKDFVPHNKGHKKIKSIICKQCNTVTEKISWNGQKFCKHKCSVDYRVKKKYGDYLENQEKYSSHWDMRFVKNHILKEQNYKCEICKIENKWNNKPLVFVLDHIDGDAINNFRENLRLLCHNCDSQLDTYKSKNKNSSRKERYLLNYKNI